MIHLRLVLCALLLTGCATAPVVIDPNHDPADPSGREGSTMAPVPSLMANAGQFQPEQDKPAKTPSDGGEMKDMPGMKGNDGMNGMKGMKGMDSTKKMDGMSGMDNMQGMKDMSGTKPAATLAAHPAKPVYTCPMHPEVQQDHPGKCPKCGMTLVIKKGGNDQ